MVGDLGASVRESVHRPHRLARDVLVLGLIWGGSVICQRFAVREIDPDLRGHGVALVSAALMALATIYARRRLRGVDPLAAAAGQLSAGLLPLLPLLAFAAPPLEVSSVSGAAWLAVALSGTVGLGASFVLFLGLIERHGALPAMLALYVMPLAATLLGTLFLGETVTPPMVTGGLLILAGLFIFSRR